MCPLIECHRHRRIDGRVIELQRPRIDRRDQDSMSMDSKFEELKIHYLLECSDMKTSSLDEYLVRHQKSLDTIFSNAKFKLYKESR